MAADLERVLAVLDAADEVVVVRRVPDLRQQLVELRALRLPFRVTLAVCLQTPWKAQPRALLKDPSPESSLDPEPPPETRIVALCAWRGSVNGSFTFLTSPVSLASIRTRAKSRRSGPTTIDLALMK